VAFTNDTEPLDGLWLYNSTVTITQNASAFPFVSVAVSPKRSRFGRRFP
jgi:hypothetical protein